MLRKLKSQEARLRFEVWRLLGQFEYGLRKISRMKPKGCSVVEKCTDLLIEGFPRSGNTYAYLIARETLEGSLKIAHHVHGEAQFRCAAKYKVPAMLLIRDPVAACTSLLLRQPALSAAQALSHYASYHRRLWPLRDNMIIVPFESLVEEPMVIFESLANRYPGRFGFCGYTAETERRVREGVRNMDKLDTGKFRSQFAVALPTEQDKIARDSRLGEIMSNRVRKKRNKAMTVYGDFLEYLEEG